MTPTLTEAASSANADARTLYVYVHGMSPDQATVSALGQELTRHGRSLVLRYGAQLSSNADPRLIAENLAKEIAAASGSADHVVLVAHSMGAALMRRALVGAQGQPWVDKVQRLVLLSGVSRGWDLSGERAPDASLSRWLWQRVAYWGGHMLDIGGLPASFERGSPFIADLRLEWMRWMHARPEDKRFAVILMLGDIDDIVQRGDNEDLRVMAAGRFSLMRIRGSGHSEVLDFKDPSLGAYRRERFDAALTDPVDKLVARSEELPAAVDRSIKEVVFVLHGIRDLGRWSANFEQALFKEHPERREHMVIVSPRYGYFGMGPFLFKEVRQRHVRWLMDVYTETLAKYPEVKPEGIRFFGHSNGTYLLAKALEDYRSMELDRIVFAGSVVPRDYRWNDRDGQVRVVRNYVGTEDWVVALFPRLFELRPFSWLGNDLGSAGFNGFDRIGKTSEKGPTVENVKFVDGEHSAFESRVTEIVDFMTTTDAPRPALEEPRGAVGQVLGVFLAVWLVWLLLAASLIFVTIRVVAASPSPAWPVLLIFGLLVLRVLQTV